MIHFAFFIMIFGVIKGEIDGDLVRTIEDTLEECSTLVEAMGMYLGKRLGDNRRRNDMTEDVKGKMQTCDAIFEVVDTLRTASAVLVRPAYGTIGVYFSESYFMRAQLSNIGKNIGDVLYIASEDGDQNADFHNACDNKGATIAIFETITGNIFGGYTDQDWAGGAWRSSDTSFLFSLRPKMKKYAIIDGKNGTAIYGNQGPYFGAGPDLWISQNALDNLNSYTNNGATYEKSNGYDLNNGERNFQLEDYVVLQVKDL